MTGKRLWWLGAALLLALVAMHPAALHLRSAAVLLRVTGQDDPSGLTTLVSSPVDMREERLALPHRSLRALRYLPRGTTGAPTTLLLHGVHPDGIDEPRFQAFARALASVGLEVVTPELPELAGYEIVPTTVSDIRDCARVLAQARGHAVGAFGISFAGGLLLIAAADDEGPQWFRYLVSLGGHHSLQRLSQFYAGRIVRGPDGKPASVEAHPYGSRVIAYAHAEQFFEPVDVVPARAALRLYLSGRYRQAREAAKSLSEPGRARLDILLDDAREQELGDVLLQAVARNRDALAAVSPAGKLAHLRVPTFLVHGTDDSVIPSIETRWLARELPPEARRDVLVTPVLGHADLSTALPAREYLRVVAFMAHVLSAAGL